MTRTWLAQPLALVLILTASALETHAQKSMGKTVPATSEPNKAPEELPASEPPPKAPWQTASGPEKPTTIMVRSAAGSAPAPMTVMRRGNLAIREGDIVVGTFSGETLSTETPVSRMPPPTRASSGPRARTAGSRSHSSSMPV